MNKDILSPTLTTFKDSWQTTAYSVFSNLDISGIFDSCHGAIDSRIKLISDSRETAASWDPSDRCRSRHKTD